MRNYSKVGGREGMPGYRTPASFLERQVKKMELKSRTARTPKKGGKIEPKKG